MITTSNLYISPGIRKRGSIYMLEVYISPGIVKHIGKYIVRQVRQKKF